MSFTLIMMLSPQQALASLISPQKLLPLLEKATPEKCPALPNGSCALAFIPGQGSPPSHKQHSNTIGHGTLSTMATSIFPPLSEIPATPQQGSLHPFEQYLSCKAASLPNCLPNMRNLAWKPHHTLYCPKLGTEGMPWCLPLLRQASPPHSKGYLLTKPQRPSSYVAAKPLTSPEQMEALTSAAQGQDSSPPPQQVLLQDKPTEA